MATITMIDRTGQAPTREEIEEALDAVTRAMPHMVKLMVVPELALNLGNIRRCLALLQGLVAEADRRKAEEAGKAEI